ncbi:WD40-repeat-containing domain protein [Tribonema minus]|uniref:WD40-repeat-containing domain protein n=1 Tax=Tribonema minus TaxID=303371 RepID=A0A835Z323_9STRA|nr:WD40-repeat-containing domain protein [Tribonema minus]
MSSMNLSKEQENEILFVGFNQDSGCFACGTDNGFRIYNVDPFRETFRRVFSAGVGIVEMLFRCNLLALVGGGRNPRYPPNKVMIWDDHQNRCIGELSFRSEVKAVKLRRDRVVVALAHKIYVYRFSDLKLLDQINTIKNESGLLALCPDSSNMVLACPGISRGHVNVELYDTRKSTLVPAHESDLAQLALNSDGSLVATASDKGTLIRVFDTSSGALVQELRRGMDRADITSICFNQTSSYLACCSDRGTVHIFDLKGGQGTTSAGSGAGVRQRSDSSGSGGGGPSKNTRSGLSFLGGILPMAVPKYFSSEWSYAQVRGVESRSICAFGAEPNTIVVVSADGSFLLARFDEPGECERVSYAKFIRGPTDEALDDMGTPLGVPATAPTPTTVSRVPTADADAVAAMPNSGQGISNGGAGGGSSSSSPAEQATSSTGAAASGNGEDASRVPAAAAVVAVGGEVQRGDMT